MSPTHYSTLGVAATAPAADIKRAYRRLAVQYHPDKHGGNPRYEEQFKAVAIAYGVLSDPGRRATYDFQLAQAARRTADEHRRAAARQARPNAYGMPPVPTGPLRTRPPAGARERHYRPIAPRPRRFTRRDWTLVLAIVAGVLLFGGAVKITMDRVTANANYADGLRAYTQGRWATAYSYFESALHFRPGYAPALRRQAELDQLIDHNYAAARTEYRAALAQAPALPRRVAADLHYRLSRCETLLGDSAQADLNLTQALALDSALAPAWLARGGLRLFYPRPSSPQAAAAAAADLRRGLAQLVRRGQPAPWRAQRLLGLALARAGRPAEARAAYEQVLAARPTDGCTHYLLGCLARQAGDTAAACGFFRRAVALGYEYARPARDGCP